jgi:hypothetical protein
LNDANVGAAQSQVAVASHRLKSVAVILAFELFENVLMLVKSESTDGSQKQLYYTIRAATM